MAETASTFVLPAPTAFTWVFKHITLPFVIFCCRVVFLICGPLRVRGRYRVPRKGGLLILPNHLADVDPVAIQLACNRPVHFMAKSELFDFPVIKRLIPMNAFPVKRGEPDRAALKHAIKLLQMGEVVCIFPEGQLSQSGELQELKPGIALIVRSALVPVICCGLRNTQCMMPYGTTVPRPGFRWIDAIWGEVREFEKASETEEILSWVSGQLRDLTTE